MSSTAHSNFFQRGRINANDLGKQDPKFILDYATRYDVPKTLAPEEIVSKIFEGRREFIPILPNHTWALEDDRIVLIERREPPKHPRYQSSPSNTRPIGDAFPEPPEDTYSRSPSPTSEFAEERPTPSRLPLVYPPVGLGSQPVPEDWLQQMLEQYQEDHETVVSDLQKLVEEVESVSYETVRVMSKIRNEQEDTWHLLDTVKEVCGNEFLDKILRDVHATTRFELSRKLSASGAPLQTVLPTTEGESGGTIRSKKFTKDKQIFSVSGGPALPLHTSGDGILPSPASEVRVSPAIMSPVETSVAQESAATATAIAFHPPAAAPEPGSSVAQSSATSDLTNTVNLPTGSSVPSHTLRGRSSNKRARPISLENTSDDVDSVAQRLKRRKASLSGHEDLTPRDSTSTGSPPPTTSFTLPSVPADGPSSSRQHAQRPDKFFTLREPIPPSGPAATGSIQAAASSSDPSTTTTEATRPEEPVNLWTARAPNPPVGPRRKHELVPFEVSPSPDPLDSSQSVHNDSQLGAEDVPHTTSSTFSQPESSSTRPTTSIQPIASSSQSTTNSSQPIPSSSQPVQQRRAAPLKRASERLIMNSDGTLEIINIDTPERIAASEELVRDAQRRGHRFTLASIAEQCAPRYPFLFAGKKEDDYHSICPPSPRASWR
ncbi:hypothetical protein J3R30DRAFT_2576174 [Lentinula aciculospora]|uniref:Uncharacterized protein n=1 Tax=Lentinula aciculospora TaxID=153920 RepID=A0A9W9AD82_9AGAR|nr:hypothetical protein J3R30DRAFT_2576174 [Lentinula aciculospora]